MEAPAAIPDKPSIIEIAAELIGSVKIMPINTETTIPMKKGCNSVETFIKLPRACIALNRCGPIKKAIIEPDIMVTNGVIIISSLLLPEIKLPISEAITTHIKAPSGSPGPEIINWPFCERSFPLEKAEANDAINPVTAEAKITNLGEFNAFETPIPITGPVRKVATLEIVSRKREVLDLNPRTNGFNITICYATANKCMEYISSKFNK